MVIYQMLLFPKLLLYNILIDAFFLGKVSSHFAVNFISYKTSYNDLCIWDPEAISL